MRTRCWNRAESVVIGAGQFVDPSPNSTDLNIIEVGPASRHLVAARRVVDFFVEEAVKRVTRDDVGVGAVAWASRAGAHHIHDGQGAAGAEVRWECRPVTPYANASEGRPIGSIEDEILVIR